MLTLEKAETIAETALNAGMKQQFAPLCVVVLDAGGHILTMKRNEAASIHRPQIAMGKASGCIGLGVGGRTLAKIGAERPVFAGAVAGVFPSGFVPVPGGVLVRDDSNNIVGAVGVTGDTSDNDELCAIEGIEHAGFIADSGE